MTRSGFARRPPNYRLLLAGAVEEKILALHDRRRELADAILTGLGATALDLDALRGPLAEPSSPTDLREYFVCGLRLAGSPRIVEPEPLSFSKAGALTYRRR